MSQFIYPVYIPSKDSNIYFKELSNENYKNFAKIVLNDDIYSFNVFVESLLTKLAHESIDFGTLTNIDKLCILLNLRASNIAPVLNLTSKNSQDEDIKFQIDLGQVLDTLEGYDLKHNFTVSNNNLTVKASLPKQLLYTDIYEVVTDCVDEICLGTKCIQLRNLTYEQRVDILHTLPSFVLPGILKLINEQEAILKNNPLITIDTEQDVGFGKQIHISLLNNSIYEILKMLYGTNLRDFYSLEYQLIKKFKFSYNHINTVTPAELNMYFDIISEDLEKERQAQDEQEAKSKTEMPPPPGNLGP